MVHISVDSNIRIAYPLTQTRVGEISNEAKNTEAIGGYDGFSG